MAKIKGDSWVLLEEFENVKVYENGGKIKILIDSAVRLHPSKSGKTTLIASTGGGKSITKANNGPMLGKLNVTMYI